MAVFTSKQVSLFETARYLFLAEQGACFPLYYLPGLRGLLGGDGRDAKFPCSISWMTRKGLPRVATLVAWNIGWMTLLRAFFKDGDAASMSATDWLRGLFMLKMYGAGFVTAVLTP